MAKRSLSEQLDRVIEALLTQPDAAPAETDARLEPLLRLAPVLNQLPSERFRERLKTELLRRTTMTTATAQPAKDVQQTVTPYLIVQQADALVDFIRRAFDGELLVRGIGSAGGVHAEVRIGDSKLMIGGGGPGLSWHGDSKPTALHLYFEDADAVYRQALQAGATSIQEPVDQFYGDREAGVKDAEGNFWYIATHQGPTHVPEGLRTVTPFLHARGADQMIDFLKRAFDTEDAVVHRSPEGRVMHAVVKIGNSVVEMGEAHGEHQPMPTVFYVSVPDADAAYRQALAAGATSVSAPDDRLYGARVATVSDINGNTWYLAAARR